MLNRIPFIALLFVVSYSTFGQSSSQQVFSGGGNHIQSGNTQISFTIGEPLINTLNNSSSTLLTQGFHQTNIEITGIDEVKGAFSFNYYPIPVTTNLVIESNDYNSSAIVNIYDASAKLIASQTFENNKSQIDLSQVASGNYFVTIESSAKKTLSKRTFSVIK